MCHCAVIYLVYEVAAVRSVLQSICTPALGVLNEGSFRVVLQIKALQPLVSCEGSTADEWLSKSVCPSALIRAGQLGDIACTTRSHCSSIARKRRGREYSTLPN